MNGVVYVCAICGKRSWDELGERAIDGGWDESCFLHAVPCHAHLVRTDGPRLQAGEVTSSRSTGNERLRAGGPKSAQN